MCFTHPSIPIQSHALGIVILCMVRKINKMYKCAFWYITKFNYDKYFKLKKTFLLQMSEEEVRGNISFFFYKMSIK